MSNSMTQGKEKNMNQHRKKAGLLGLGILLLLVLLYQQIFKLPEAEIAPPEEPGILSEYDHFDILLMGLDGREETQGTNRTDTMILVSLDTKEFKGRLLSIPRDTRIQYQERWMKINGVYELGGADATVEAVEALMGTKVDRYAVVDFSGVEALVDLMGGIEVDVPKRMYKPLENIDLQPGFQFLDGSQALGYMRYRDGSLSDFDRSDRQKEVILQLVTKALRPEKLLKLPEVIRTALKYMDTDLTTQEILSLAKAGNAFLDNGMESVLLPGKGATISGGWYYIADVDAL